MPMMVGITVVGSVVIVGRSQPVTGGQHGTHKNDNSTRNEVRKYNGNGHNNEPFSQGGYNSLAMDSLTHKFMLGWKWCISSLDRLTGLPGGVRSASEEATKIFAGS